MQSQSQDNSLEAGKGHKTYEFTIDGDAYETDEREVTPRELLERFAHLDVATHYLILLKGREQIPLRDALDEAIKLTGKVLKFISVSTGPTPVS